MGCKQQQGTASSCMKQREAARSSSDSRLPTSTGRAQCVLTACRPVAAMRAAELMRLAPRARNCWVSTAAARQRWVRRASSGQEPAKEPGVGTSNLAKS